MPGGNFFSWLREDRNRGRPKVGLTVSGFIVDKFQRQARNGMMMGFAGLMSGGLGMYSGYHKEMAPPRLLPPVMDRSGQPVKSTYTSDGEEADDTMTNAILSNVVWHLRTLTPDAPIMDQMIENQGYYFQADAAGQLRNFLGKLDAYEDMIKAGRHRLIVPGSLYARRTPTQDPSIRFHKITWAERVYARNGRMESETPQTMEVEIVKRSTINEELFAFNPQGIF